MKTKKLIVAILMFIAVLMIVGFTNTVDASSLGYLTITKERTVDGITYKHQLYTDNTLSTKNIWKLVTCTQDGTITNTIPDLYCLRAGLGFTSESPSNTIVQYNQSYSLPEQYSNLVDYFSTLESKTTIFDEDKVDDFNAVMWVLDNMLLEGATDAQVENYLKTYAGYSDETLSSTELKENVLSRADIEAIQQLVIWYFTNSDEEAYNKDTLPTLYMEISGDEIYDTEGDYKTFADIFNTLEAYGTQRQNAAATLYSTLITKAKEAVASGTYKPSREITVYLAGTDAALEQPVVRVEEAGDVDVALRKFISGINGEELTGDNSRAPIVDTSNLNKVVDGELQTTAIYNHPKTPLRVSIGDTVTYTLRLYNEGDVDTYIKEVKDYLPAYLEYTNYGDDEGIWWILDEETGRIATTTEFCKVVGVGGNIEETEIGKNLGDVLIPAAEYNEETDDYTLSYVDIQISCTVMPTTPYDTNVTNIAEITKMADKNGTPIQEDRDSVADENMTLPTDEMLPDYTGGANGKNDPYYDGSNVVNGTYYPGQEDDDDFEKIIVETPTIDLALRKFISAVGDTEYNRAPVVDTSGLRQGEETAIYNHSKVPVQVEVGDVVTYTLRLYNEGDVNARVSQVTDYLDKNLKYVPFGDDVNGDWWTATEGERYNTLISTDNCIVVNVGGNTDTSYIGGKLSDAIIPAYNSEDDVLSYVDIEVHCQVMPLEETTKLTNIAEITGQTDEYGTPVDTDRDSTPGDVELPEDFPGYKDDEIDKDYVPGQEDDDDFEKVIVVVPEVDLSLRKFISAVDGEMLTGDDSREPIVDTTPLDNKSDTTAIYNHPKNPVTVKKGGLVTYTIRVYNEGEVDAYVSEIRDYLPEYLIYLPDNETNIRYGWTYNEETREVTTTITAENNTAGDEIYQDRTNGKLLLKYDGDKVLDYIDVQIVCKVDENAEGNHILTNLAQITEIRDEEGNELDDDKDSVPDGNFDLPSEEEKPTYKDDESDNSYVPGQEDDDDFDKVLVKPDFDLALRKFITAVGTTSVNNRYPQVSYEDGKFTYTHTKEPLEVVTGDIVTYTIRVYNEGEADGYANEITDDVPEGLEFVPDNETNVTYRWKMLDENQEETDDVTKAKYIVTDYLSEEQENETGRDNLIKAFDKEAGVTETNPDYRDVQIAFRVTYKATTKDDTERTIINTAQISADSDDDKDSEPNRDEVYDHDGENEDDIDYDQVKVKYFDLSLLKWVGQTIVTLNGETTTTDTGHTAETSKNEDPVKIEIKAKDVNKISIKYVYTIRITNEGEIAGYAQEITDYIPEGLKFVPEDNPDWYEISDGVVGTAALENTLLQPGESAEVKIILTWINGTENFGEKVNLAEISKDYNESDSPDVDSTPNNKVPDEDDIDDAPVILAVKTGVAQTYIGLILIIIVTFAGGVGLIKKYVLE